MIQAERAQPCFEEEQLLPPLSCMITPANQICMVGDHIPIMTCYLHMLAGVDVPCAGEVSFPDRDAGTMDAEQCRHLRRQVAFVARGGPLLSVLNGIDNIKLPAQYHGLGSSAEIDHRVFELIAELEYQADHTVLPAYMTGLQRRHLAIARALILEPKVLFVDDPFAGLDRYARGMIGVYLDFLVKERGLALVTSNANLAFVQENADMIIYCGRKGMLVFDDWESFVGSHNGEVVDFLVGRRKSAFVG
jgi:ABC-type transporter Mla maintaining outer membrane lipid asymmetry ATPase subunit MlaF